MRTGQGSKQGACLAAEIVSDRLVTCESQPRCRDQLAGVFVLDWLCSSPMNERLRKNYESVGPRGKFCVSLGCAVHRERAANTRARCLVAALSP